MLRKLIISALLLVAFLPVNSWAISTVKYDLYGIVHGSTYMHSYGSITGTWNEQKGKLYDISGTLHGYYGDVDIYGGTLWSNGAGKLFTSIHKYGYFGEKDYFGKVKFKDSGWFAGGYYDNYLSDNYLDIWGGGKLFSFFTPYGFDHSYYTGKKFVGLDLWGEGTKVPEPATMGLMSLGLIGMAAFRRKKAALA